MQALTTDQYKAIIHTMREGRGSLRANPRCAAVLTAEANLGLRIGDILRLKLSDIVKDGGRYRLNITEEKTGKRRTFTVPGEVYSFLEDYAHDKSVRGEFIRSVWESALSQEEKSRVIMCGINALKGEEI